MYLFIFEDVEQLTGNYHSGGGLVVLARDEAEARSLVSSEPSIHLTEKDWKAVVRHRLARGTESRLYVFPDAGCC